METLLNRYNETESFLCLFSAPITGYPGKGDRIYTCLLYTSSPAGLTEAEAQARLERDGKNLLQGKKRKGLLRTFFGSLCDRMTIVLFLAAGASYAASRIAGETDYDRCV